jgi:pimeloyl-ACP methyl ester carboxylesterase
LSSAKIMLGWCGLLLLLIAGAACSSKKRGALAPLEAAAWRIELPVPGFGPASVALPLGAVTPRPIAVVLHGAVDHPEWQCGSFRGVLGGKLFILCPRGIAAAEPGRFGLGSVDDSAAELRAALAALKARFGAHVAASPILLIGYAEGARVAAELARQEPAFFARVALVNGEPSAFTPSASSIFALRGGKRVLFFCTTSSCDDSAVSRALLLARANVPAKSVRHDVGPYLDAPFAEALARELPWLLEGDARFGVRAAPPTTVPRPDPSAAR